MLINPGVLNKKIQIIEYLIAKDADGFEIKTENIVLATWAQVSNVSGTEITRGDSDFSQTKTRFLLRTPKITIEKDYVIKFRNEIYEIVYVNDYGYDGVYTEILTVLVVK